jgi:Immunoglobulin I-set domain.
MSRVGSGTPPLDVVWVKDGVEIPDCEYFRYVGRGDGRFELRLADVFPQDSGTYSCEAYNEHGEAVTSSTLYIRGDVACWCSLHLAVTGSGHM